MGMMTKKKALQVAAKWSLRKGSAIHQLATAGTVTEKTVAEINELLQEVGYAVAQPGRNRDSLYGLYWWCQNQLATPEKVATLMKDLKLPFETLNAALVRMLPFVQSDARVRMRLAILLEDAQLKKAEVAAVSAALTLLESALESDGVESLGESGKVLAGDGSFKPLSVEEIRKLRQRIEKVEAMKI